MPPFKSSVSILLPADAADSLLQILENSVHVPPALLSLHQLLIDKAHCQGDLVNGVVEDDGAYKLLLVECHITHTFHALASQAMQCKR